MQVIERIQVESDLWIHLLCVTTHEKFLKLCRRILPRHRAGKLKLRSLWARRHITLPDFMETDPVAHCGNSLTGDFVWSLTLTDILTGTEYRATWNKGSSGVLEQIKTASICCFRTFKSRYFRYIAIFKINAKKTTTPSAQSTAVQGNKHINNLAAADLLNGIWYMGA
jgi:hypothetical protein